MTTSLKSFRKQASQSRTLARLQRTAEELLQGSLLVMLRRGDQLVEITPCGDDAELPPFCQLYRSTREGLRCCLTCRSLMSFGACYRGTIDYMCHGGVWIIAAAVPTEIPAVGRPIVASCAFADRDREKGWKAFQKHASELGLGARSLKASYTKLPVLTPERRTIARELVEIAAEHIGEMILNHEENKAQGIQQQHHQKEAVPDSSLYLALEFPESDEPVANSKRLVQLVCRAVAENPGINYNVARIARAANITPNYFSSLFRLHTGEAFRTYLLNKRLDHAKNLLRDMTLSISEVADRCGFSDKSYFTRAFHKATGQTPSDWRASL